MSERGIDLFFVPDRDVFICGENEGIAPVGVPFRVPESKAVEFLSGFIYTLTPLGFVKTVTVRPLLMAEVIDVEDPASWAVGALRDDRAARIEIMEKRRQRKALV